MPQLTKVLIANRGEIAVRVARACADAGIASVAVYADDDRNALHVRVADEAYALGGVTAAETYLDMHKLISVAHRAGCDAVHPGYGFLSESAGFAQAVIDAGLTWIGPPPAAIRTLGDKVSARHVAAKVGAPLAAGTSDPVANAEEIEAFADAHGLPIVIKAAFGGGGRGLKVVERREDIPELFDLAVREATADFGRGECFVEQYLDRPRHVETQCLADSHGNVVVVSTRDCSLQRRHQKLVEEAPAPFITKKQQDELVRASKAILKEAGYVGAGTCEFLLTRDGTISFLEVNTRLQVEHPVSEEISGIDLVREQFRIAAGEALGYAQVKTNGHAFEFRLCAEDASTFVPTPGTMTTLRLPGGPGVRLDFGYEPGDTMPSMFDSMIGKVIVWGIDRTEALARARRALAEILVGGVPTNLPFHRAVLKAGDLTAEDGCFGVHTRWIDTDFAETLRSLASSDQPAGAADPAATQMGRVVVEVGGKRLEIAIPSNLGVLFPPRGTAQAVPRLHRTPPTQAAPKRGVGAVTAPMQGVVVKVAAKTGDTVAEGDLIVVIEAMKMEQSIFAPTVGTVADLTVTPGDRVTSGQTICTIK